MDEGHDVRRHWELWADEWTRWARTEGHDAFWSYRERFRAFLPPPGAATLEVGCGEGRVARELADLGHRVVAVDVSRSLLTAAREAGSAEGYVQADAAALPFPDAAFDRVAAYNVLMDVADMPAAVREIGRVLRPGGAATISIVHPFVERGRFTSREPDAPFVVEGSYFHSEHVEAVEARDSLEMHFAGWARPLQDYTAALNAAGFAITELVEPTPSSTDRLRADRWTRLPLFCWMNVEQRH